MELKQLSERKLMIGSREIEFDQRIIGKLDLGDRVLVLLNPDDYEMGDEQVGRNIAAYGEDGEELWRVPFSGERRGGRRVPAAFFGLHLEDDGSITVGTPSTDFTVDPQTGRLSNPRRGY